jgi:hypothetical protein
MAYQIDHPAPKLRGHKVTYVFLTEDAIHESMRTVGGTLLKGKY